MRLRFSHLSCFPKKPICLLPDCWCVNPIYLNWFWLLLYIEWYFLISEVFHNLDGLHEKLFKRSSDPMRVFQMNHWSTQPWCVFHFSSVPKLDLTSGLSFLLLLMNTKAVRFNIRSRITVKNRLFHYSRMIFVNYFGSSLTLLYKDMELSDNNW